MLKAYFSKIKSILPAQIKSLPDRFQSTNFTRKFSYSAFWVFLSTLFGRGGNLIAGICVARLLGKEAFGQYGMIQSSILMFSAVGSLGLGLTATRYIAEYKNTESKKAARILFLCSLVAIISGLLMAACMYFFAPILAEKILSAPELSRVFQFSSFIIFFATWQASQDGAMVGFQEFRTIAFINLISGILLICLTIIGANFHGLIGAVGGWACANVIQCVINVAALWRVNNRLGIKINFSVTKEEFQLLWKFSIPAALGGIIFSPTIWVGNAILVNINNGFVELGKYNAGYQWFAILLFVPGIINNAFLPMLAECKDNSKIKEMIIFGVKLSLAILCPLVLLVICMSPLIMSIYGQGFKNDWVVLSILACAALVAGIQHLIGNVIAVMEKMWLYFQLNLFWAGVFVLCSWVFVGFGMKANGLALAAFISYLLRLLLALLIVWGWYKK